MLKLNFLKRSIFGNTSVAKFTAELPNFLKDLYSYGHKRFVYFSVGFEKNKDFLIRFLMIKRGRYSRPFIHFSIIGVITIGVIFSPFLANTYPIFSSNASIPSQITSFQIPSSITVGDNVFQTDISQKPRNGIITYSVERGDTLSTIANKFGISENTIRWENNLTTDTLSIDQQLKILPVTGVAYTVQKGDTVYSIASKFNTNPQKIVDFPFNDFANPETFSLVDGETLFVPDGIKPQDQPYIPLAPVYIAQGPNASAPSASGFTWPVHGVITQFASWYHMALDIAAPYGTPIVAAKSGVVIAAVTGGWNTGYGNYVIIDNGNNFKTLYAHMEAVNVQVGQSVAGGSSVIGWIGLTGNTTGPHVHFEIKINDQTVNPLPYLE